MGRVLSPNGDKRIIDICKTNLMQADQKLWSLSHSSLTKKTYRNDY